MSDSDEALRKVWALRQEERADELVDAIEPVFDLLLESGYVEADGRRWRFTQAGVDRAEALAAKQTDAVSWPYEDDRFPRRRGIVVMRTILDRGMPVLRLSMRPRIGGASLTG